MKEYPVSRVLTTKTAFTGQIIGILLPDRDAPTWVLCNASPHVNEEAQLVQVIVSFYNITELKNAEHGHETILLVEDEPAIRQMTTMMLTRQEYPPISIGSLDCRFFFGCGHYPYCGYTAKTCNLCNKFPMIKTGLEFRCQNPGCENIVKACRQCDGMMVERTGKYGRFLGCSNYGQTGCGYTEKLA